MKMCRSPHFGATQLACQACAAVVPSVARNPGNKCELARFSARYFTPGIVRHPEPQAKDLWLASARLLLAAALALIALAGMRGRAHAADPVTIRIFHADSLKSYIGDLSNAFQAAHPSVQIKPEGSGSLDAIRKVTDLRLPCDILITADWRLLAQLHSDVEPWVVIFAGNSIGLLYTPQSKSAAEINARNWYDVITRDGVRYGHSDPARDPAGYWTLIMWRLAERYYKQPGLAAKLGAGCPPANIRPHSIYLVALLESSELDYYFGYASDARLGKLNFLALPPEINLGDLAMSDQYASASAEVGSSGNRRVIKGAPIAFGVTLVSGASHRMEALEFIALMTGPEGRKIAAQNGLVSYPTAFAYDPGNKMPRELQGLTRPLPK
jgi:molybdate/tungstate transport system substrate-binding protein